MNLGQALLVGVGGPNFWRANCLYGILLRAIDVNALFIGVKKSRFFKFTLHCKVYPGFGLLRRQFHQLIGRQR